MCPFSHPNRASPHTTPITVPPPEDVGPEVGVGVSARDLCDTTPVPPPKTRPRDDAHRRHEGPVQPDPSSLTPSPITRVSRLNIYRRTRTGPGLLLVPTASRGVRGARGGEVGSETPFRTTGGTTVTQGPVIGYTTAVSLDVQGQSPMLCTPTPLTPCPGHRTLVSSDETRPRTTERTPDPSPQDRGPLEWCDLLRLRLYGAPDRLPVLGS